VLLLLVIILAVILVGVLIWICISKVKPSPPSQLAQEPTGQDSETSNHHLKEHPAPLVEVVKLSSEMKDPKDKGAIAEVTEFGEVDMKVIDLGHKLKDEEDNDKSLGNEF